MPRGRSGGRHRVCASSPIMCGAVQPSAPQNEKGTPRWTGARREENR
nr:MAG TPA: hypothetical protein [Caudoviricetes sp.]